MVDVGWGTSRPGEGGAPLHSPRKGAGCGYRWACGKGPGQPGCATGRAGALPARSQVAVRLWEDQLLPASLHSAQGAHRRRVLSEARSQGVAPMGPPLGKRCQGGAQGPELPHHLPKHWVAGGSGGELAQPPTPLQPVWNQVWMLRPHLGPPRWFLPHATAPPNLDVVCTRGCVASSPLPALPLLSKLPSSALIALGPH